MCAWASAVARSSGTTGRVEFTVIGSSASFWDMLPIDTNAVARGRAAMLTPPLRIAEFMLLFGQSDSRPPAGADVPFTLAASVTRTGLSQVNVGWLLRKNDPS